MKYRFALSALALATVASTAGAQSKYADPNKEMPCWALIGSGVGFVTDAANNNGKGYHTSWWCVDSITGTATKQVIVQLFGFELKATPSVIAAAATAAATSVLEPPQKLVVNVANAVLKAAFKAPTGANIAAFDALFEKGLTALDATKPAPVVVPAPPAPPASAPAATGWVVAVATNKTDNTRPAYEIVANARVATSTKRATAGTPCLDPVFEVTPAGQWMRFSTALPNFVALCAKAAP